MKPIRLFLIDIVKKHRHVLGLVGIQSVVYHAWIFSGHIFTYGDIGIYPPEAQRELISDTQSFYAANSGFGDVNIAASSNPFIFLYGVLGKLGVNAAWSEKLLFFFPIVFGVALTSYFLIRYLTRSNKGAFIGALVYSYNVYFLVTLTGALYLSLSYAFVPLVFLAFLKVLDGPTTRRQLLFALSVVGLGYIEFRTLYIALLMMALYFFLFLFTRSIPLRGCFDYARRFILPCVLSVLMNLFWILPIVFVGALTNNALFDRGLFGNGYFDIVNAFTVFHPWWTWNVPSIFVKQAAPPIYFLFPILISSLLFKRTRDYRVSLFIVLFLIGVFLTKQSGAPFEMMYQWMYAHLPGFNAFRESSKFFVVSSLALSVLIGYLFAHGEEDILRRLSLSWGKWLHGFIYLVVLSIVFVSAKTVATGDIGTMFIPRDVPEEYVYLNAFLQSRQAYSRVLWLPHTSRFGLATNMHPSVSMLSSRDTLFASFSQKQQSTLENHLYAPFDDEAFRLMLNNSSVGYVIIPSNLKWDEIDTPWRNPVHYREKLDSIPYLKRINDSYLEKHDIFLYENRDYRPHIYTTKTKESASTGVPFVKVDSWFLSPAEYRVHLKSISGPAYINFSESYHPDWKLRAGEFGWFDVLTKKDYFLPDSFHSENDAKLNSFLIDPAYIRQHLSNDQYRENPDGSIDVDLTLYFKPQSYYLIGLVISLATVVSSVGVLLVLVVYKHRFTVIK